MGKFQRLAAVAIIAATLSPTLAVADWDDERIARDHPIIVEDSLSTGMAAGDVSRLITKANERDDVNRRVWLKQLRQRMVAP